MLQIQTLNPYLVTLLCKLLYYCKHIESSVTNVFCIDWCTIHQSFHDFTSLPITDYFPSKIINMTIIVITSTLQVSIWYIPQELFEIWNILQVISTITFSWQCYLTLPAERVIIEIWEKKKTQREKLFDC